MRSITFLAVLLSLAACERAKHDQPAAPAAAAVDAREVAAADGYGAAGETVNAVAFWSHPSVNFQSLLIAAGDGGVKAYNIETGDLSASAPGAASDVAVFYLGAGASAQGYAIARSGDSYAMYAIDNDAPALAPLAVTGAPPGADAFCASSGVLYEAGRDLLSAREIAVLTGGAVIGEARKVADAPGIAACHVDDRSGDVIVIGADGAIRRVDPATGESFGLAFVDPATASALFLMTTPEPENGAGGAVMMLDGANGVVSLYDLVDGHALGAVRVKSTFDLDAVAAARTIAAGYGNYGNVYRDGALAVVASGAGAPIRLVPFNAVMDALKITPGENVDPRTPQPAADLEQVIDIEFAQP